MTININTIAMSGSILLWLGVIICLGGLVFFLAVSGGISPDRYAESWPMHDTYYLLLQWKQRMIFLLPMVAGLTLVASGLLIRRQVPALKATLMNVPVEMQKAEPDAR